MDYTIKKRDIHSELAAKHKVSKQVIMLICNHPFIFAKKIMADPENEKTLMFHYFGKIRVKRRLSGKKAEYISALKKKREIKREEYLKNKLANEQATNN